MSSPNLEADTQTQLHHDLEPPPVREGVALLVSDAAMHRLLESLLLQLELTTVDLPGGPLSDGLLPDTQFDLRSLNACELILADEPVALRLRDALRSHHSQSDAVHPALIAVRHRSTGPSLGPSLKSAPEERDRSHGFDAFIVLPQEPSLVLAQLSVTLYAHRAYVRRYQSALDELHLNRRIFRSVTSGISVADATRPDLPLVYVNPAFEVMTGYSLEEVQGRNCRFLQGEDRQQPARAAIREALAEGRELVTVLKNYRKNGTAFWNELSLSPIRNREGKLTHVVGIQQDVTARVEFEAALRESEKLAAVGRLAASIAHEINNPLESVTNLIYLARHAESTDEMLHYLDQADRELHRASQITSQSLRFYRQSTRPLPVRPQDLMDSVLDLYQAKLDNASIRVERSERGARPVLCLESEIRQVVSNLIRNAIDASTGSSRRLIVRTRHASDWRRDLRGAMITIADNGSGIPPEVMKNLYKAFFTTKGIGGTGLGLWVSSEIITRHHGRLRVRSSHKPGKSWTVFQLFLPYEGIGEAKTTPVAAAA